MEPLTRRLGVAAAALLAALLASAAPAGAAGASLDVLSVDTNGGQVTTVVTPSSSFGGADLTSAPWQVTEGGRRVTAHVEPVSNAHLEVVLALDTSGSMLGAPIDSAKAAAEAFVASLPAAAQVAVVSFSSKPVVVVPLTVDRAALIGAIRGLRAQGETALYDAVAMAAGQFSPTPGARRELVVLSDGGDTVSKTDEAGAITALTNAHVTGYVASLVTKDTAGKVLDDLAGRTGGRVVPATDAAAIRSVFGNIGAALTNQYRLTFPAVAGGQTDLSISVTAAGATASADRVIQLPVRVTPPAAVTPRVMPSANQGWMKTAGLASVAAGLLALGLFLFVPTRKRRITSRWVAEHASHTHADTSLQDLTHRASEIAERGLRKRGWAGRLDTTLEQAGIPLRPGEFALVLIGADAAVLFVGSVLFGPLFGIGLAVGAGFFARTVLRFKVARRRSKFEGQLSDTLQLLSGSLRAGYGLAQALDAVAKNAESPTAEEFGRLIMETRVGRSLPDALAAVAGRVTSQDFDWVVEAITINREIGGDLTELLDRAATTIRERDQVRRQIKSLSAEGRLSAIVLLVIPVLLFLYMHIANPSYVGLLTSTRVGWLMLAIATAMMTMGGLWLRKLVRVVF